MRNDIRNTFASWLSVGVIGLMGLSILGPGCGGGGGEQKPAVDPVGASTEVKLLQVEQRKYIGAKNVTKRVDGGQMLLLTVSIKNIGREDMKYGLEMFKIRKKDSGEPPYEQANESGSAKAYDAQYGRGKAQEEMLFPDTLIHPNFTAKKILVFSIPEEDKLKDWSLRFIPKDQLMDFDDPAVKVVDNRDAVEIDPKALLRMRMQGLKAPH